MELRNGDRYGRLVIVGIEGKDRHKNNIYRCKCDCGNTAFVRGHNLTSGNTRSCGCLSREVKNAQRLPQNRGLINKIILQYKRHARERGLSWELTFDDVSRIIQSPCVYCGAERSNHRVTKVTAAIAKTNSEYLRRDYGKYKMRLLREVRRLKGRVTS